METRMAQMKEMAEERNNVERKVDNACILIQKHVRGMIQRIAYAKLKAEKAEDPRAKLKMMLADMQQAVWERRVQSVGVDESARRIQRAARKMIARIRFRHHLYKLLVFRNIVEMKMHKEKMATLYGFEQLIINTEEQQELELAEQEQQEQAKILDEMKVTELEPSAEEAMKSQIMKLTNVSSSTSAYILQALLAAQEKDRLEVLDGD